MNDKRILVLVSLLLCSAAGPLLAGEGSAVMAGHWKLQDDIAGIHKERSCTFTQTGSAVAGTCRNADGPVSVEGKVTGDKITLQYKVDFSGQELTIVCTGMLKSGNGSGTAEAEPLGISGSFTLTRSK